MVDPPRLTRVRPTLPRPRHCIHGQGRPAIRDCRFCLRPSGLEWRSKCRNRPPSSADGQGRERERGGRRENSVRRWSEMGGSTEQGGSWSGTGTGTIEVVTKTLLTRTSYVYVPFVIIRSIIPVLCRACSIGDGGMWWFG